MRCFRSLGVGACVMAIGCGGGTGSLRLPGFDGSAGHGGVDGASPGFTQTFTSPIRDVDILFMVDNSLSMQPLIAKLTQSFTAFTQVLEQPPGLPNVHIAVVSSNLGAAQVGSIPNCPVGGDGGEFQFQIGAGTTETGGTFCGATGLQANQHFISNVNGVANYDTTLGLDKVFSCIASLGDHGCGFEHQLQSVVRALNADGAGLPPDNVGFLRPQAHLAIVLLTNEDDCSAPPNSPLFDPASMSSSDRFGPLASYRCNEFGHLCNGAPPPRTAAASFGPGECVPAEAAGQLIAVADIVAQIKSLKVDPTQILVAAIAGPPDPYGVVMVDALSGTSDATNGIKWPNIAHSCTNATTNGLAEFADPGVRIKAFVDAFGPNGLFLPACAPSYVGAFQTIGRELELLIHIGSCFASVPGGVDPLAPSLPAGCTATVVDDGSIVPPCPSSTGASCFTFVNDPMCPDTQLGLSINPPLFPSGGNPNVTVHCPLASGG